MCDILTAKGVPEESLMMEDQASTMKEFPYAGVCFLLCRNMVNFTLQ